MKIKILRENFNSYIGAIHFDDWSDFISKCNSIKNPLPVQQACEITGISFDLFNKVIDHAFAKWRDSTSKSLLHGISYLELGKTPTLGNAIFRDLMWQTRFLIMCRDVSPTFKWAVENVRDKEGKPILVKGEKALTSTDSGILRATNNIIRCLYLYWYINSLIQVKLPKSIYRGIRAHDLYGHNTLEPAISAIFRADKSHSLKRKEAIDFLIKWICERKLHEITNGNVLSFTASIPVAKYFSNGEGIILVVDPRKVEIISSEIHDERLSGKDPISNKSEREYIVRLPKDYEFKPEDIIINDLEYFVAEQNPLSVSLFDHDNKQAIYFMNNIKISAFFRWNSAGTAGSLRFNHMSRQDFKKEHGFDPLPTAENLTKIKDFVILPRKTY